MARLTLPFNFQEHSKRIGTTVRLEGSNGNEMSTTQIQSAAASKEIRLTGGKPETPSGTHFSSMPYLWFAPALLVLFLVTLYPTIFVGWLSFQKTRYYQLTGFVGFANYFEVFGSSEFWRVVFTSIAYVVGSLAGAVILGMAAALVLNSAGTTGSVLRVLILFPWTLSMSVVGSIWLWLLNPSFGPIPYVMQIAGIEPGLMLGDPSLALPLLVIVTAWWSFPYVMVMATAAMQSIPSELYEAVDIDGGGAFVKFRYVTLTHILPTLGSTALTLSIMYLTLMTLIIVMTGGGPLGSTTTLSFEAFRGTIQAVNIGPTAVVSIVVLLINVALGVIYTRLTGRVMG